jgi:hypothetical protein
MNCSVAGKSLSKLDASHLQGRTQGRGLVMMSITELNRIMAAGFLPLS